MKYDLLDGRWHHRVASVMPSRLHDNIGAAEKEATDGDSRALSFGFEQVTQLVFPSIDQSREVEVPSKIFDLIETRFDIRF